MNRLEKEELKQYQRQIILPELGLEGQQKLKGAKILMVGAGGLGCPVLQYLVAAGVGTIGIVDDDVVDQSNLHRQILYSTADVGKSKAETAKIKLSSLNPYIHITAYPHRLTRSNAAAIIEKYDLIIDGSDNFLTRYLTNDTCLALNKPLVFGSVFKFEGQVSVFNYRNGPNYRDIFPENVEEPEALNCSQIGVIGILPGIIGLYMANEAIKICCEFGETLAGKLMTYNALDNRLDIFTVTKSVNLPSAQEEIWINLAEKVKHLKIEEELSQEQRGELSLEQLKEWQERLPGEICLIDVRETYEYDDHNIGGLNIPLYELKDRLKELPKDKKLVICCQTGQRSKIAVNLLKPVFKNALFHLKNGI
ncbi:HesA/MoeB/ThiF family protein [Pedobacter immunditicola]|uniref:HesA/MoeB/ThiF family protein n=1 Tax=Pedobacter immunditicola TaxID=3133440 RepID=UPI0030B37122